MEGDRIAQAIHRIEAATGRISAASNKLGPSAGGDQVLAARHAALREEVSQTLAELDDLIDGLGQ